MVSLCLWDHTHQVSGGLIFPKPVVRDGNNCPKGQICSKGWRGFPQASERQGQLNNAILLQHMDKPSFEKDIPLPIDKLMMGC